MQGEIRNILILEDNIVFMSSHKNQIRKLADEYSVKVKIFCFSRINKKLLDFILENKISIALLDVEVGKENGIQLAEKILEYQPFASIIFISAFKKYMEPALELIPAAFLVKPVEPAKLNKLFVQIFMQDVGAETLNAKKSKAIYFKKNWELIEVKETELLYVRTWERRLMITTKKETFFINNTIKDTLEMLSSLFVKVSRDIIVNKTEVGRIRKGCLTMSNGDRLDIPIYGYNNIVKSLRS